MNKVFLGKTGIEVSEIGIGTMAFSHGYGKIPEEQYSIEAIREAMIMVAHFSTRPKYTVQICKELDTMN